MSVNRVEIRRQLAHRLNGSAAFRKKSISALLAALALLASSAVQALNFPDMLDDPLLTKPPVLTTGATLPRDSEPIACPENEDITVPAPLTLGDAIDLALCRNPQIKGAWALIKVQAGLVGEARGAYLPTASISASKLHNDTDYPQNHAFNTTADGKTYYGNFNWRLFDFGGRAANRESANQLLAAAIASHEAALQKTLDVTIGAYFDAITAHADWQARIKQVELAQTTLSSTQRREQKGVSALSDTLQAKTALAKAQLEQGRSQGDFSKALSVLVYSLGLAGNTQLQLPDEVGDASQEQVQALDSWLQEAEQSHPAIVQARAEWASDKAKVQTARATGLPTLDFSATYYQNGFPNQGLSPTKSNISNIGFTVNIPLFEGFVTTYKIRGAKAQAERTEAQLLDTQNQILMAVVKAHADAVSSLGSLTAATDLLNAAQSSVTTSQLRYSKGAADILELLSTQSALAEAEHERIKSIADWRSARLRLMSSAGLLGREAIVPRGGDGK